MVSLRRLCVWSLAALYLLILAGGIVRSTGSGMGCPDWPKCFGKVVPPTSAEQLPPDYKQQYAEQRIAKNQRLSGLLQALGYHQLAKKILNDPEIYTEQDFNPFHTWVEYINRLIGAITGLLILSVFLKSLPKLRSDPKTALFSLLLVIMVAFQAWVGSLVVSTNLLQGMITFHMMLAVMIVIVLNYVLVRQKNRSLFYYSRKTNWLLFGLLVFYLVQIFFGTEVRTGVDEYLGNYGRNFEQFPSSLGWVYYFHRSFSLLGLGLGAWLFWQLMHSQAPRPLWMGVRVVLAALIASAVSGVVLSYLGLPRMAQPVHLTLAIISVGTISYLLFWLLGQHRLEES